MATRWRRRLLCGHLLVFFRRVRGEGAPPGRPTGAMFLTGGQGPAERRSGLPLVPGALPARQGVALRSACHPPIDPQILPKSRICLDGCAAAEAIEFSGQAAAEAVEFRYSCFGFKP